MSKITLRSILFFVIALSAMSCSKFRKIQKSGDWKVKYEAALEYYEKKDYYHSNVLLEEIIPIIRGTEEAEKANFIYAYTYYYQQQYILSAHYFKLFTEVYGRSDYVEEAAYMHAHSLYNQSPQPSLDQTSTYEAIAALQSFLNKYPYSKYEEEADNQIDELQVKLEEKAYESAKLYYQLRRYKAALVAFENFQYDFPDSKFNEEIAWLRVETAHNLASVSIRSKQQERFQTTVDLYEKFVDKYPNSKYLKQAERIYEDSIEQLTIFADQNNQNQ
jgi:outer membrane protein assembly factor BamD